MSSNFRFSLSFLLSIFLVSILAEIKPPVWNISPGVFDYKEHLNEGLERRATVTIKVGEQNGFQYTVNGKTDSASRISLSGDYYNNADTHSGFARLYLATQYPIGEYELRVNGQYLYVHVYDVYHDYFYYEVIAPSPVSVQHDLRQGQVNGTAIIVVGPSRSSGYTTT